MKGSSTNNQFSTALSGSPDNVPHRNGQPTFSERVDAGEHVTKGEGEYPYSSDAEYRHVTGQFCTTCIKQDVCGIKEELHKAINAINNELDRVNVFAQGIINCKRYYPDMEHQIQPLSDYDYNRSASNPANVRTALFQNGGMNSHAE